ncbi:hypothetical protein C8F04DRAFT_962811 [Mycena alexandri]|uniref:Uncharacterized protein n=1 Tax=Mycena alexandri TaxID=1745969 RepID=A0AAD6SK69_9AGAR|nr:hypothetical protein C8F04DRAFT_962811 [Mycena alexandri]
MRQKTQSADDDKLRRALENMRYGACTDSDLEFLESRIAGFRPENPKLNRNCIRNVSIITARNSQKDALNNMGAERFARDTNQELNHFCSIDRISSRSVDKSKWKSCLQSEIKKISLALQKRLWDAPPSTTNEYIPGKLSVCIGMPVMLRANDATELCITKGQEAVVCGWDESEGPAGQRVLDTLFVTLVNPPRNINIEGLPQNVVPLVRTVNHITILLQDDTLLSVLREQVVGLLNFGMTDYTSQGKSRAQNPVELANCKDHRSYYVALSRGFTAEGTVIVQGFSAKKITSGMSGYLRQELRELEVLDEITRLRYEGKLPITVAGIYRRRLLRSYYAWKTDHRDPPYFHSSLRWNKSMGPRVPEPVLYSDWKPSISLNKKRKNAVVDSDDNLIQRSTKKRKLDELEAEQRALGSDIPLINVGAYSPVGLVWDSINYSCAYDATFTILANLWTEDNVKWSVYFSRLGSTLGHLADEFQRAAGGYISLEDARDSARRRLHSIEPANFPYGHHGTSIDKLCALLLPSRYYAEGTQVCPSCGYNDRASYGMLDAFLSAGLSVVEEYPEGVSMQQWVNTYLTRGRSRCRRCTSMGIRMRMTMQTKIISVPSIMVFDILHDRLLFNEYLIFDLDNMRVRLRLRGIIYGGQGHFTSRFIDRRGGMWFHDGITTGNRCLQEIGYRTVPDLVSLHRCGEKKAVAVVYAREL